MTMARDKERTRQEDKENDRTWENEMREHVVFKLRRWDGGSDEYARCGMGARAFFIDCRVGETQCVKAVWTHGQQIIKGGFQHASLLPGVPDRLQD